VIDRTAKHELHLDEGTEGGEDGEDGEDGKGRASF